MNNTKKMNLVFTTTTDDFQPISYGDSYLYSNYGRLSAFLSKRLSEDELNKLAKPLFSNSKSIEWYSSYHGPMKPIDQFSTEHQVKVEKEYLELIKKINRTISEFKSSNDKDKEEWAKILTLVFKAEDNKLISNGEQWVMLWGWQFRNKLIVLSPEFQEIPEEKVTEEIIPEPVEVQNNYLDEQNKDIFSEEYVDNVQEPETEIELGSFDKGKFEYRKKLSFWERLKRFFRWLAYRFWGLMLFIVLMLLLFCLCKKCRSNQSCADYKRVNDDYNKIENAIKDRCEK